MVSGLRRDEAITPSVVVELVPARGVRGRLAAILLRWMREPDPDGVRATSCPSGRSRQP